MKRILTALIVGFICGIPAARPATAQYDYTNFFAVDYSTPAAPAWPGTLLESTGNEFLGSLYTLYRSDPFRNIGERPKPLDLSNPRQQNLSLLQMVKLISGGQAQGSEILWESAFTTPSYNWGQIEAQPVPFQQGGYYQVSTVGQVRDPGQWKKYNRVDMITQYDLGYTSAVSALGYSPRSWTDLTFQYIYDQIPELPIYGTHQGASTGLGNPLSGPYDWYASTIQRP